MSFSRPGQLLVSRSFYEVVSCLSRITRPCSGTRANAPISTCASTGLRGGRRMPSGGASRRPSRDDRSAERRRLVCGRRSSRRAAFALVAAPVVFPRFDRQRHGGAIGDDQQTAAQIIPLPAPADRSCRVPRRRGRPAPAPDAKLAARIEKKTEALALRGRPGRLELAVTPWGEIVIDGKSRGVSPPLRLLEIPAGRIR